MSVYPESSAPNNLPAPLTAFIGRRREVAEVFQLLTESRLLTLTGPGGCGKTRLALQVANRCQAVYEQGVWLVEFAPLKDARLVPQAVASALGVREQAGTSILQSLMDQLQNRSTLLVLDNCEHLVASCAQLSATLLERCPGVRLLATSREALGVPGEVVWNVPPLSLPDPQPWRSPGSEQESFSIYQESEAIQLFVARAKAADPTFVLTHHNAGWAADICRRLDGLPLAIELAAARVRTFSLRQISERLLAQSGLLTSRLRTSDPRHLTLDAALDWSYDLLPEKEQKLLRWLAVFQGGWTLESAEAVCGAAIEGGGIIYLLAQLVDKSLVVVEKTADDRRYHFLETIRHYARQKLEQAGEANQASARHLSYFLQWAEAMEASLSGANQLEGAKRFETEHDNLRAALEWCLTAADQAEAGLRLAAACSLFWKLRGFLDEGRRRLTAALALPGAQTPKAARAKAVLWAANLAYLQSDYPATRAWAEEGLQLARSLGAPGRAEEARALDTLGELATEVGDYVIASPYFEAALEIYRELGDKKGSADMLMQLGWAAMRVAKYSRAAAFLSEAMGLFRELDDPRLLAFAVAGKGELALRQGQYAAAVGYLEESLALHREVGDRWGTAAVLGSLGWVALLAHNFSRMRELLRESITIRQEIGERGGVAWCLEKLAEAVVLQSQALSVAERSRGFGQAAQIFGAASALRASIDSIIDPADQLEYEEILARLRTALGEKDFAAAWAEGGAWPFQEAIEAALRSPTAFDTAFLLQDGRLDKEKAGGLSRRELEAAELIGQGKTNREIAGIMVVKVKTVETYVTRILNKLGFQSRVQIATWAYEVGLCKPKTDLS